MATKQKWFRVDGPLRNKIEELTLSNPKWSPAQIHRQLEEEAKKEAKEEAKEGQYVPDLRTIQRMVKASRSVDKSGPWRLWDADSADSKIILEILADVIEGTEGQLRSFTRSQAEWIAKIRHAAPDLHPWFVYILAMKYQKREETEQDTEDLDAYLAFAPWRSTENDRRYLNTAAEGWIKGEVLHFLILRKKPSIGGSVTREGEDNERS